MFVHHNGYSESYNCFKIFLIDFWLPKHSDLADVWIVWTASFQPATAVIFPSVNIMIRPMIIFTFIRDHHKFCLHNRLVFKALIILKNPSLVRPGQKMVQTTHRKLIESLS